jgi:hypothetical protein
MGRTLLTRLSTRFSLILVALALLSVVVSLLSPSAHAMSGGTSLASSSLAPSLRGSMQRQHELKGSPNIIEESCNGYWDVRIIYNINGGPNKYARCWLGLGYTGINPNIYGVIELDYFVTGWVKYYDNLGAHYQNFTGNGKFQSLGCPPFCYHGTVKMTQLDITS